MDTSCSRPSKFPWTWGCLVNLTWSREYYLLRLSIIMLTCERIFIFLFLWLLKKIMLASIQGDITMSNHLWKKRKKGNFSSVHFQKLSCFDRSLYFFLTPVESNFKKNVLLHIFCTSWEKQNQFAKATNWVSDCIWTPPPLF